jgi:hypothetical protein
VNTLNGGDGICCGGSNILVTAAVPEPTSLAIFGSAALGIGLIRRRPYRV